MQKYLLGIVGGVGVLAASSFLFNTGPVVAQNQEYPVYDSAGRVQVPTGFRAWVFVGAPLTPEGLNNGSYNCDEPGGCTKSNFPEFKPTFPDSSRTEPSGRGYFNGEYNGIDMTVKDSKRFSETNKWGFFTFGHHPLPYNPTAAESPVTVCAFCHIANVANTDMTWIQFYPLLRDKKGY